MKRKLEQDWTETMAVWVVDDDLAPPAPTLAPSTGTFSPGGPRGERFVLHPRVLAQRSQFFAALCLDSRRDPATHRSPHARSSPRDATANGEANGEGTPARGGKGEAIVLRVPGGTRFFASFIDYLYCGMLAEELDEERALVLYFLAHKYEAPSLAHVCRSWWNTHCLAAPFAPQPVAPCDAPPLLNRAGPRPGEAPHPHEPPHATRAPGADALAASSAPARDAAAATSAPDKAAPAQRGTGVEAGAAEGAAPAGTGVETGAAEDATLAISARLVAFLSQLYRRPMILAVARQTNFMLRNRTTLPPVSAAPEGGAAAAASDEASGRTHFAPRCGLDSGAHWKPAVPTAPTGVGVVISGSVLSHSIVEMAWAELARQAIWLPIDGPRGWAEWARGNLVRIYPLADLAFLLGRLEEESGRRSAQQELALRLPEEKDWCPMSGEARRFLAGHHAAFREKKRGELAHPTGHARILAALIAQERPLPLDAPDVPAVGLAESVTKHLGDARAPAVGLAQSVAGDLGGARPPVILPPPAVLPPPISRLQSADAPSPPGGPGSSPGAGPRASVDSRQGDVEGGEGWVAGRVLDVADLEFWGGRWCAAEVLAVCRHVPGSDPPVPRLDAAGAAAAGVATEAGPFTPAAAHGWASRLTSELRRLLEGAPDSRPAPPVAPSEESVRVYIKYVGWPAQYNRWIDVRRERGRLAPLYSHTLPASICGAERPPSAHLPTP
jgi:hypothetical protein